MNSTDPPPSISPYLLTPARALAEVCRSLGHDRGGLECPTCPIRSFCMRTDTSRQPKEELVSPGGNAPIAKRQAYPRRKLVMAA